MGTGQRRWPRIESEGEVGMKTIVALLKENQDVSDYKINLRHKESAEYFYVKGRLETVRHTDTWDKEVTVYVDHGEYKGDSRFLVYPSTTKQQIGEKITQAVEKARLICNKAYTLPAAQQGQYSVPSNFSDWDMGKLCEKIAECVFTAEKPAGAELNSVEIFVNRIEDSVLNSTGVEKKQIYYRAMVEAIPTFNGKDQSVELYQQYNFNAFDEDTVKKEISEKLFEVKARYEAKTPENIPDCDVILNKLELSELFSNVVSDLHYATVYGKANLFSKGDAIQKNAKKDKLQITMAGNYPGSIAGRMFDGDGMSLRDTVVIADGKAVNYYGPNRFGQYLDEAPTGELPCIVVSAGSADSRDFAEGPYLEVLSMSDLQVDFYSDYIGGEVRLAYYHDGNKITPVTGISITGAASEVLNSLHLSRNLSVYDSYAGPEKAILTGMKIF